MANIVNDTYSKADVAVFTGLFEFDGVTADKPANDLTATLSSAIFFLGGSTTPPPTPSPRPATGQMWPRGSQD